MALISIDKAALAAACPNVQLGAVLGEGGNARVFAGTSLTHGNVAVKFMLNDNRKRYTRFRDEVLVVTTSLKDSPRVIPILEHHLPQVITPTVIPWYVMPSAEKLSKCLKNKSWTEKIEVLAELADGLVELHAKKVAHRDIKPENLFKLDGTFRYGDFGIAWFPENAGVTSVNEPMGPFGYMAPEMLTRPADADPFKADVFSLAKTVWTVLTEERYPFAGQYAAETSMGLATSPAAKIFVTEPLDSLLEQSTRLDPVERPTAEQFAETLRKVLAIQDDHVRANHLQWSAAEWDCMRGYGVTRVVWEAASEIARVITILSRRSGLNHCFLPSGGGQALVGAAVCEAGTMLTLNISHGGIWVVQPKRLILERFPGHPNLSYAVLETGDTGRLGVGSKYEDGESEHLKQVNEFDYLPDDSNDYESSSQGAGVCCQRFFVGGLFVIAPGAGAYNDVDDYRGTAKQLGLDGLRQRFARLLAGTGKVDAPDRVLIRKVRLLSRPEPATYKWELAHIDEKLLCELIEVDDALVAQRDRKCSGRVLSGSEMHDLVFAPRSAEEIAAQALINRLTAEQRAEFLAITQVALGDFPRLDELTTKNLRSNFVVNYISSKLGNGYIRKALARFGLEAPAPSID